ncbi:HipA domain-containing protein [Catenovulum sp. 2E275]|uniref:HipA domain-containing protein n=1 Tax=Catenovulum sp. 2E275 TaxID=2980497 RepID=UPI0021CF45BA|nr:HipA domain-containing protein [Catenovulum sp. 2E275]MCU4675217.1 HipA domain-containing protein [Catenovulum sp. 2E275]
MMRTLDVEMYIEGHWQTIIGQVEFDDGSIMNTTNKLSYLTPHQISFLNDCAQMACSINYPVCFDTIDVANMKIEEGVNIPSLWLSRFDLIIKTGKKFVMISKAFYAVIKGRSGQNFNHFDVIAKVVAHIQQVSAETEVQFDPALFVCQWFERDLLNVMFGNSDNHARNSSLIKTKNEIKLSPIYDFAPMRVDPEDIRRTITWGTQYELGGISVGKNYQ